MEGLKYLQKFALILSRIIALPLVGLVMLYQKTLSPDHGLFKSRYPYGYCKFYPTCSEYARQTLSTTGVLGLPKIIIRIIKCNPFSAGGVDLPKKV